MSSTKSQVAVATNIPSLSSTQSQKDYSTEEPLGRQNSFGNNRRGNMKGKHLTRSHAMREATSPPRTPTPRAEHHAQVSPNGQVPNYQTQNQHHHHQQHADGNEHAISSSSSSCSGNGNGSNNNNNNNINNKLHAQSTAGRGNSPIVETPAVIITSQHSQPHQTHQQQQQSVAICNEVEFPKLTPPKSTKSGGNGGGGGGERGSVNQRNGSNCNSSNGSVNDGPVKIEYNNNNNCNSNGKKLTVDLKTANANNGGGGGGRDGRDHDSSHGKGNGTNHKNHHHSQSYNNASIALHQALNIVDNNNSATSRSQPQNNTSTPIYNSGMNYQLHSPNHDSQHSQQHQQPVPLDKENRSPRNDSQNSNISNTHDDDHYDRSGGGGAGSSASGGGGNKKHRTSSNSKGSKPRLKNISSSSGSVDGASNSTSNNTSGFISRENSGDQFTDHGGTDLLTFFKDTLNKNLKDRHILLKIEKDLMDLICDKSRSEMRFPSASSYNRMLIHRTAAYFGMDHNVDSETQQCVIVAATKTTRVPEIRFKSLVRDIREDGRKSILKRDTHSFDEVRQSSYLCPDRGMLDRKAKSFEEREEDYERARSRIFSRTQNDSDGMEDNYMNISWASAAEQQQQQQQQQQQHQQQQQQQQPQNQSQSQNRTRPSGKMLKVQTSTEPREGGRDGRSSGGAVPKAHSFTGANNGPSASGGSSGMMRSGDSSNTSSKGNGSRIFTKQDMAGSTNTPWRMSPSSSGSLYHFDPSNLPSGVYHHNHAQASSNSPNNHPNYNQPSAQGNANMRKPKGMQMSQPPPPQQQQHQQAASPIPPAHQQSLTPAPAPQQPRTAPPSQQPVRNAAPTMQQQARSPLPIAHHAPAVVTQPAQQSQASTAASPTQVPQQVALPKIESVLAVPQPVTPAAAAPIPAPSPTCALEGMAEMSTQTVGITPTTSNESTPHSSPVRDSSSIKSLRDENASSEAELRTHANADLCDNNGTGCLSITTTTSTKNFDRIEVQKFKNQATSPNIPTDKEEPALQPPQPPLPISTTSEATKKIEEPVTTVTGNQTGPQPAPARNSQPQAPAVSQAPTTTSTQPPQETPHSSRSTPFSNTNNEAANKRASEEPQPKTWTYTHSYQAPDGSTVFHTTTTPNSTPYCTTTYQQGPDGSVYAIPQGMVYAYPQQIDTGSEVQGYFMPVYDPAQQRSEATAGLIQAGPQAIYQPTNSAAAATMVPVATAYPTAQFATTNGAQIFPGQVIYSSEQFTPGGATVAAAAPPASGQLQQIPMTTYPISYSYPYNGCWGQTMTYYVPHHQALTGAVTAAPLMSAPPPPPPPGSTATTVNAPHVAGGVNLAGGLIATTPAAAGPSSNPSAGLSLGNSASTGANLVSVSCPSATTTYQTHGGTTYFGTGRIKRPAAPHYGGPQSAHHPQLMTTIPGAGGGTTYQLGHAVPTLTLAAPANTGAASNDLNAPGAAPTTTMYALPQHTAIFPANVFPYATAAAPGAPAVQPHTPGGSLGQNVIPHAPVGGAGGSVPHAQQSTNAVITTPYYAQHPPVHGVLAVPTSTGTSAATVHAPGPAAIPIVDPATLNTVSTAPAAINVNSTASYGGSANNSSQSQSAPSTPHSMPAHSQHCNPPLFSTPPIVSNAPASSAGGNGNYNSSSSSTPHYYNTNDHQQRGSSVNSTHTVYTSSYDKRHSSGAGGRKPPTYATGGTGRTCSMMNGYMGTSSHKPALLGMYGERPPSSSGPHSNNSYHNRSHALNKRSSSDKSQPPLLSAPPQYTTSSNMSSTSSYHANRATPAEASGSKPPVRLNAGAAAFRHKSSTTDFSRRSVSQRNSPGSNSNSNDTSNHNSPNSMIATSGPPAIANCYTTSYVNNASTGSYVHSGGEQQTTTTAPTSLYIASRSHIPPQMHHGGAMVAPNSGVGPGATTVMTASAADVAASMAAVNAAHGVHTQPLISYNTGHSGVYFKYVPTYNAHPSVALPNSRRSPSTDLRPQMAQMAAGINMMIPAPPRHAHGRHTNPNYKGNRPR